MNKYARWNADKLLFARHLTAFTFLLCCWIRLPVYISFLCMWTVNVTMVFEYQNAGVYTKIFMGWAEALRSNGYFLFQVRWTRNSICKLILVIEFNLHSCLLYCIRDNKCYLSWKKPWIFIMADKHQRLVIINDIYHV